jgi:hypothetical protein
MKPDLRFLYEDICHFIFEMLNKMGVGRICLFDLKNSAELFEELLWQFLDDLHLRDDFE